jgi:hypothetical protein
MELRNRHMVAVAEELRLRRAAQRPAGGGMTTHLS